MLYPQYFIDDLKNRADLVRIIEPYAPLKKKGANWMGCCPFHQEKTPSFSVNPSKGFYKCFGCLEENELIWTDKGLKPIGQVCFCDKVFDLNGELREITHIVHKESDVLLGVSTDVFRYDPLWLTPDHTCLFVRREDAVKNLPYLVNTAERLKFRSDSKRARRSKKYQNILKLTEENAESMRVGDYLAFPVVSELLRNNLSLKVEGIVNPKKNLVNGYRIEELPVNERTARLYGLWLAEGSVGRGFVRWTFGSKETDYAEEVVSILKDEFNLTASIYHHGAYKNICEVNCSKTDLAKQLVYWFGKGAASKKIPSESLFWSVNIQKALLKGYRDGDGNGVGLTRSVSRELSYGLFALAVQAKEFISLLRNDEYTDKNGQIHKEYWTQYPRMRESLRGFYETIEGTEYYLSSIKEIKQKHEPSRVVDITVKGTNSFTTKLATVHNCGKGGTAFNFVMEIEGLNFPEAIKRVAEISGVPLPEPIDDQKYEQSKKRKQEQKKIADQVIELNQIALEFWENHLRENNAHAKAARDYLEKRQISLETQKAFHIGFAPDSWDSLLNLLKEKGADEKLIEQSGLVSKNEEKNRIYDRFRGRIIFPVLDVNGNPVAFGARILAQGEPKYLNSPETPAYIKGEHLYGLFQNKEEIRQKKFAILVEGYLDLLALYQFGVRNTAASLGTAFTEQQARLLGRFTKKVVINYDGDKAGIKAARRAVEVLLPEDFEIKVLILPDGQDPDDFIRANGADSYNHLRGSAFSYLQFVLEESVRERNLALPKHKAEAIEEVLPMISTIRNPIQKRESFDQAMSFLRLDDQILRRDLWKNVKLGARLESESVRQQVARATQAKMTVAEQHLLELLIYDRELRDLILPQIEETDYEMLATASVFRALLVIHQNGLEVTLKNLLELTEDDEAASDFVPVLLLSEPAREKDEAIDEALTEAENCVAALRAMAISRRILEISQELVFAEQNQDFALRDTLVNEQIELARMKRTLENRNFENHGY
ncbi:MAG TPA: DNA primase [Pyrinomonadaceae bacterium]|nr:DNA primase [Pyrinomonadaceae bacterium]